MNRDILGVVPALNEERAIEACLRSLMQGYAPKDMPDVIVADGGSRDRTRQIVARLSMEFPNIRLIDNPDRLQSAGINRAVTECAQPHHRILVRADAHATYPPRFLQRVAKSVDQHEVASVVVPMDAKGSSCFAQGAAWIVDTPLGSGGSAHRGGTRSGFVDHGHHAGMRLDWFRRVGGYDPSFSHNEDAEFDHRLRQAGGEIWLDADLRLDYYMRNSLRALMRQYWNYGRGRARTVVKHRMQPRLRQLVPAVNLGLLIFGFALVFAGISGRSTLLVALGLAWPLLYLCVLVAASVWMFLRHRSIAGLWAGPALAGMHLAWGGGFISQIAQRIFR